MSKYFPSEGQLHYNYPVRNVTQLPDWFLMAEEKVYQELAEKTGAIMKACPPKKPIRCPIDSLAPGVCVPRSRNLNSKYEYCYYRTLGLAYRGDDPKFVAIRKAIKDLTDKYGYGPIFAEAIAEIEKEAKLVGVQPIPKDRLMKLLNQEYRERRDGKLEWTGKK